MACPFGGRAIPDEGVDGPLGLGKPGYRRDDGTVAHGAQL